MELSRSLNFLSLCFAYATEVERIHKERPIHSPFFITSHFDVLKNNFSLQCWNSLRRRAKEANEKYEKDGTTIKNKAYLKTLEFLKKHNLLNNYPIDYEGVTQPSTNNASAAASKPLESGFAGKKSTNTKPKIKKRNLLSDSSDSEDEEEGIKVSDSSEESHESSSDDHMLNVDMEDLVNKKPPLSVINNAKYLNEKNSYYSQKPRSRHIYSDDQVLRFIIFKFPIVIQ